MSISFRFSIAVALSCCLLMGCGEGGPRLVPVEGKVTLDGKPLANKTIMFSPQTGTQGNGAGGIIDGEGNYKLTAVTPGSTQARPGIAPGDYRVMVMEQMAASTNTTSTGEGAASAEIFAGGSVKSNFPQIYSTPNSPLLQKVSETGGKLDIELKSKP